MDLEQKAREIAARMALAGDDGSWAGELDFDRVWENGIAILKESLRSVRNEAIEESAKVADEHEGLYSTLGRVANPSMVAEAIRSLKVT